jgi:ATP-binding cassette subfamily B protein RaxB
MNFGFSPDTPLVRNFECRIAPGTHVVITGPSGCGKSTLLRIMSGQLQPGSGQFLVDDVELELWDRAAYVQQIGVVLQSDHLFQGTIAENIAGFSACPDMVRVRRAATAASVWDDIRQMPMQTETLLGDTGSTLSGGQVQRLVIARALYREPKILFLDEATSQLDIDTENRVLANIGKLDITVVSVAHRPGAIAKAAQVITISDPTVKCCPSHPE